MTKEERIALWRIGAASRKCTSKTHGFPKRFVTACNLVGE